MTAHAAAGEPAPGAEDAREQLARLRRGEPGTDKAMFRGARLIGANLAEENLSGMDLSGADLSQADLSGANLSGALLGGATLYRARLDGAELLGADLSEANLGECHAEGAGFGAAVLRHARLEDASLRRATLTQADVAGASMSCCDLTGARLCQANLAEADLQKADLRDADLSGSRVDGAVLTRCDLRGARLSDVAGYESADWIGVDLRDADLRGALQIRRFIMDENYLHEFRTRSRGAAALYTVWWLTSDCGRSFLRWGLWVSLLVALFAGLYALVDVDYGDHPTFLSPLYFSVVTITTLGYGDAVPASTGAQVVAMLQVLVGYLCLGGLISIFANKMARRAE